MTVKAPSVVTVASTSLFRLAAQAYGDATLWTKIAEANGRIDPWITEPVEITIPRDDGRPSNGGILGDV